MFTAEKTNNLIRWWKKLITQAENGNQQPLLFFKYNRSRVFVVTEHKPENSKYMFISWLDCYVLLAEEWLKQEQIELIQNGV
jgi:hypothetical protein